MSIRLRLTIWYSAILALTLIAFGFALYFTLSRVSLSVVKDALEIEARRLIDTKSVYVAADEFKVQYTYTFPGKLAARETYVQTRTFDQGNARVTGKVNLGQATLPLSSTCEEAVRQGYSKAEVVEIDGQRLLVYNKPFAPYGQVFGVVQVARTLADHDQALEQLRRLLLIGGSVVTVIAFGVGWMLAGVALRPIDRITQTAQAIGTERDFGRRVRHTGPLDEVGRLATTFNSMLSTLQAAYTQEAHALQAQRRFVADASHELRTPLTTIRGNIGLLQRDPPISPDDQIAVLTDMADESERMSRLVNDLLALARADAGRPLRSETVPVRPLIEELCRKAKLLAPQRPIICEPLPDVAVRGDVDAVKQGLLILLDNALKFTPPTGRIDLITIPGDDQVAISVRDTGPGIPTDQLPHIFERFYRGDTARSGGGAGLGLAIAKSLVEAQRGTISVESSPGVGSTFTITLPQAPLVPDPQAASTAMPVQV